jgi:hypothetical protein
MIYLGLKLGGGEEGAEEIIGGDVLIISLVIIGR